MSNPLDQLKLIWNDIMRSSKQTPADFRRGVRKHHVIGFSIDRNSRHVGMFQGDITPMKRRFKGVSRTANH